MMFRFKQLFEGQLWARSLDTHCVEAAVKCTTLNRMTHLGMAQMVRVECSHMLLVFFQTKKARGHRRLAYEERSSSLKESSICISRAPRWDRRVRANGRGWCILRE